MKTHNPAKFSQASPRTRKGMPGCIFIFLMLTALAATSAWAASQPDLTKNTDNLSNLSPYAGDTVTVSITTTNQGAASAGSSHIGLYWSTTSSFSGVSPFYEAAVGSVASHGSALLNQGMTIDAATAPGTYYLGYYVDDETEVAESNENNNGIFYWTVTVRAATGPEMDVRGNGVSIADGDTTPSTGDYTDFGSTTVGAPTTRTFWVYNTGTTALTPGTITVPSGYTLTVGLISLIAAGGSDYFTVRFNAASAATCAGDISIPNNDSNENPYNFRVTATATVAGITPDAYEADDSASAARTISNGQTQNRNIHVAGNADWVRFTVGQGGAQNVRLETDGPSGDTQMWLYGPNTSTTQVPGGYSDDEGNGLFSLLVSGANGMPATLSPGTYYIKITEYNKVLQAFAGRFSWAGMGLGII